MEKVYRVNKNKTRSWLWLRLWTPYCQIQTEIEKGEKTTRPFRYDLNQIPYDYTVEVKNRLEGLDLMDRVPDELWTEEPGGLLPRGSHRAGHDWSDLACMHALEKEVATHSSILAWRIPGTEEPGRLPSMGSHRVGHDWSDLAAAAAGKTARPFRYDLNQIPYDHTVEVRSRFKGLDLTDKVPDEL